eukprot:m.204424 g.204424  ORF g.204424 m.204424 type:complete len:407 (-) comp22513_c0_seq1:165-1385(-)
MSRWIASDVHVGVPQTMRVAGFPLMQSGWNGDYRLDASIHDQVVYRRTGATVGGIIPIVPTCIRRSHSGTGPWVIAITVDMAHTLVTSDDDLGAADTPDFARWHRGVTVTVRADMPSTLSYYAFPYPHAPNLPPYGDYMRLLARMRRVGHLVMLVTAELHERIPAAWVRHPQATVTVIYAHGNGADIESCWEVARTFSKQYRCNFLAYDYVGYSTSRLEGRAPSERGCYRAARAAFGFVVDDVQIPKSEVVLWGCSIGSGPTIHLAQEPDVKNAIAGIVIESGIASVVNAGWGIVRGKDELLGSAGRALARGTVDIFVNYRKISRVECPVCMVHGTSDEIVSFSNAKILWKHVQPMSRYPPLWAEGKGHNDMDVPSGEVGRHIGQFLSTVASGRGIVAACTTRSPP